MKKAHISKLAQIIRHKIQNFLSYFQDYLYYNAIENAWKSLISLSKTASSYQELTQVFHFLIYLCK